MNEFGNWLKNIWIDKKKKSTVLLIIYFLFFIIVLMSFRPEPKMPLNSLEKFKNQSNYYYVIEKLDLKVGPKEIVYQGDIYNSLPLELNKYNLPNINPTYIYELINMGQKLSFNYVDSSTTYVNGETELKVYEKNGQIYKVEFNKDELEIIFIVEE